MSTSNERALLAAAKFGCKEDCVRLLKTGTNVDVKSPDIEGHKTPLLLAVEGGFVDVAKLLIDRGASVHAQDSIGKTSLHVAVQRNKAEIVEALVKAQANVNAIDKLGQTPLHFAAQCGYPQMVALLLAHEETEENVMSMERRIPLDELWLRNDKHEDRKKIDKILRYRSPLSLYNLLFSGKPGSNIKVDDWFQNMVQVIKSAHGCKIFYTTVRAALELNLISSENANEWIEKGLIECMHHCRVSSDDRQVLVLQMIAKHAENSSTIGAGMARLIQNFCSATNKNHHHHRGRGRHETANKNSVPWDIRESIKAEIHRPLAAIDGKPKSIVRCLEYFLDASQKLNRIEGDSEEKGMYRMGALYGIMGVVVNTILQDNDASFDHFLAETTDFLDFAHMETTIKNGAWASRTTSSLQSLKQGAKYSRNITEQEYFDKLEGFNGFTLLGLSAKVLKRSFPQENVAGGMRAAQPGNDVRSAQSTLSSGGHTFEAAAQPQVVASVPLDAYMKDLGAIDRDSGILDIGSGLNLPAWHAGRSVSGEGSHSRSHSHSRRRSNNRHEVQQPVPYPGAGDSTNSHSQHSSRRSLNSRSTSHAGSLSRHSRRSRGSHTTPSSVSMRPRSSQGTQGTAQTSTPAPGLHWAIATGNADGFKLELEKANAGGTVNATDNQGRSALDLAALTGQRDFFVQIQKSGGRRRFFKDDEQMGAILSYCANDPEANRAVIESSYHGSARTSLASAGSSLTSRRGDGSTSTGKSSVVRFDFGRRTSN